jgi:hypothetical protein
MNIQNAFARDNIPLIIIIISDALHSLSIVQQAQFPSPFYSPLSAPEDIHFSDEFSEKSEKKVKHESFVIFH